MSRLVAFVAGVLLLAGCTSAGESPSPPASPSPIAGPSTSAASASPGPGTSSPPASLSPSMAARPAFAAGDLVTTISDDLRVRSKPSVEADSLKYTPLLPLGSMLSLLEGPVAGSGLWWYRILMADPLALDGGQTEGWVAAGARDGTVWLGLPDAGGVPPEPIGVDFREDVRCLDPGCDRAETTQTVTWRGPLMAGVELRVYGVTECLAEPAHPEPGASGPCLVEHTPLPASVLTLLATAPASAGRVAWSWTAETGCEVGPFGSDPEGPWYSAITVAAYDATGHSVFAIAAPGEWWEPLPGEIVC
jgi:hypothetical protein